MFSNGYEEHDTRKTLRVVNGIVLQFHPLGAQLRVFQTNGVQGILGLGSFNSVPCRPTLHVETILLDTRSSFTCHHSCCSESSPSVSNRYSIFVCRSRLQKLTNQLLCNQKAKPRDGKHEFEPAYRKQCSRRIAQA